MEVEDDVNGVGASPGEGLQEVWPRPGDIGRRIGRERRVGGGQRNRPVTERDSEVGLASRALTYWKSIPNMIQASGLHSRKVIFRDPSLPVVL
jgi:hypothetical protein